VQLFNTDAGIGRRNGNQLELLDTPHASLEAVIHAGQLADLETALTRRTVAFGEVRLLAPLNPTRMGQVGLNYRSHLKEIGMPEPETMLFVMSDCTGAIGQPDGTIVLPVDNPDNVDHECEIALVIGAKASKVTAANAWSVIAGVMACNDVSARDVQRAGFATGNKGAGKMLPGFKPLGPGLITTADVSSGPIPIPIRLTVNGVERQSADSSEMVFSIPQIIETMSAEHDLMPGDVIITGSPAGVGALEGRFLVDGDVIEIFVGDLPPLRSTVRKSND
jgi:2-keto-4-pentenoate hydratase/2-oxohepta-3-ene-1,7-dioic acid hydratase in catechol pathway